MYPQVLATVGGSGTRLFPLTLDHPKPLVEICDSAIIAVLFRTLAIQGCRRFILGSKGACNTLDLSNYFKAGEGFFKHMGLDNSEEFCYQPKYDDKGSADSLRYCASYFGIDGDALVVSGDNLIDINLKEFMEFHHSRDPVLTVALKELAPGENVSQYGVADLDENYRIRGFIEKPKAGNEPSRMINTAFYLFSPKIRGILQEMGDAARDIGGDLIPYLTEKGYPVYGYPISGYWIDIGTPERLHQAAMDVLGGKVGNFNFKHQYRPGQWIHPTTLRKIEKDLQSGEIELRGRVSIGRNVRIERGAIIEDSHIGHHSLVDRGAEIKTSMVMSLSNIRRGVVLNKAIVGRHSTLEAGSRVDADQQADGRSNHRIPVIGEDVVLPPDSMVGPGTRVALLKYSHKILATGRFVELGNDDKNIFFAEKFH